MERADHDRENIGEWWKHVGTAFCGRTFACVHRAFAQRFFGAAAGSTDYVERGIGVKVNGQVKQF
jgi:hypothetical protein